MERRYLPIQDIETREEGAEAHVSGYFAVFNSDYVLWDGVSESIAPGAFDDSVSGDIRALYNHNTDIVLGRTSAGTFKVQVDSRGLFGDILLNLNDSDAKNAYERIKRGDITGCSIGFDIERESFEERSDGSVHWTIEKINPLYECSPCVFPAYTETSIAARKKDLADIEKRKKEAWTLKMRNRLKGDKEC